MNCNLKFSVDVMSYCNVQWLVCSSFVVNYLIIICL